MSHTRWCTDFIRSALRLIALPGISPPGKKCCVILAVLDLLIPGLVQGVGWGAPSVSHGPHCAGPVCRTPGTLPLGPRRNQGSGLSGEAGIGRFFPTP